jgi:hypothetical protein
VTFRIAVVQPICRRPGTDEIKIADAVPAVARAAEEYDLIHPRQAAE